MRKIVFLGNCQMFWLHEYFRRGIAPETGDQVSYHDPRAGLGPRQFALLQSADLLIEQRLEFHQTPIVGVTVTAARHAVPQVTGSFLWPFAGEPHPLNQPAPGLDAGPYPDELGDAFLNRQIIDGADPATAVETYCDLDIAKAAGLDRRFEITLGLQRERDTATGYRFADQIETLFRTTPLFFTPNHPDVAVFRSLVRQFLDQIGVARSMSDRVVRSIRVSPFGPDALPIHPNVGRHFGIEYATAARRYEQRSEGGRTFREYAEAYMRYSWNAELAEGLRLMHGPELDRARALLEAGLARSPRSAMGHWALARVLAQQDQVTPAVAEAHLAVSCNPALPFPHIELGHLHARAGDDAAALQAFRDGVAADPDDAGAVFHLAGMLARCGQREEAIAALRHAASVVAPHDDLEPLIQARLAEWQLPP